MKLGPLCAGLAVIAGVSGSAFSPAVPSSSLSQPLPAAVREACDLMVAVARATKGVTVERKTGPFEDELAGIRRTGCTVSVAGSFAALESGKDVFEGWRDAFVRRGWREDPAHSADGPDGTAYAFASHDVICLFSGQWDGGDDTDPNAPRDDAYTGWGGCAAITGGLPAGRMRTSAGWLEKPVGARRTPRGTVVAPRPG